MVSVFLFSFELIICLNHQFSLSILCLGFFYLCYVSFTFVLFLEFYFFYFIHGIASCFTSGIQVQRMLSKLIEMNYGFIFANKVFDLSLGESLTSEDMIDNIDEILEKTESCVCKELEISLIVSNDVAVVSFETAVSFASWIVLKNSMISLVRQN